MSNKQTFVPLVFLLIGLPALAISHSSGNEFLGMWGIFLTFVGVCLLPFTLFADLTR